MGKLTCVTRNIVMCQYNMCKSTAVVDLRLFLCHYICIVELSMNSVITRLKIKTYHGYVTILLVGASMKFHCVTSKN